MKKIFTLLTMATLALTYFPTHSDAGDIFGPTVAGAALGGAFEGGKGAGIGAVVGLGTGLAISSSRDNDTYYDYDYDSDYYDNDGTQVYYIEDRPHHHHRRRNNRYRNNRRTARRYREQPRTAPKRVSRR